MILHIEYTRIYQRLVNILNLQRHHSNIIDKCTSKQIIKKTIVLTCKVINRTSNCRNTKVNNF